MVQYLVNWNPGHLTFFRQKTHCIFKEDERAFEKWEDDQIQILTNEFMRFWVS